MAATLFLYVIQAYLETIDLKGVEFQVPKDEFIGTKNHGPSGVKVERHRIWYNRELLSSLYADDAGVIFQIVMILRTALPYYTNILYVLVC